MILDNKKRIYELIFAATLFVLLLGNTYVRSKYALLQDVGTITTNLSFILMLGYLVYSWIDGRNFRGRLTYVHISLILFIAVFILSFLTTNYADGYYFLRVLGLLFFILGLTRISWDSYGIKVMGYVSAVATLLFLMHWIVSGFPLSAFDSVFRNENYLAVLLFSMVFFSTLAIKYSFRIERALFFMLTVVNLFLMLTTSARSVVIGLLVIIFSWILVKYSRKLFSYLIYLVLLGNILFMMVYVGIKGTYIGESLNQLSRSVFNKNLFSGRSELWEGVVGAVIKHPWFGYGVGVNASDVVDTHYTAHNLYLQLLLEFGLIGLVVFFLLIFSIWKVLNAQLDNFSSRLSACFMLGILVYETFELTLFQNNFSISMLQWLIITTGLNFTVKR